MAKLNTKAMLVKLNISKWTAKKHDRTATAHVEADFKAYDSGKFNKNLLARQALLNVNKVVNEAWVYHYFKTLPWGDEGSRILPSASYMDYSKKMRSLKAEFEKTVKHVVSNYSAYKREAIQRLGKLYNVKDYPTDIKNRFNFGITQTNIPDSGDFRVTLQAEEVDKIKASMDRKLKSGEKIAMTDLWSRVYTAVEHMASKLETYGKKAGNTKDTFRDSLTGNIREICDSLPDLNISDDKNLSKLGGEISDRLLKNSPDTLRKNTTKRSDTAKEAKKILDKMSGYMGAKNDKN